MWISYGCYFFESCDQQLLDFYRFLCHFLVFVLVFIGCLRYFSYLQSDCQVKTYLNRPLPTYKTTLLSCNYLIRLAFLVVFYLTSKKRLSKLRSKIVKENIGFLSAWMLSSL